MKPQFDSLPELSSDLEWLLQSGKTSRVALAHLLVNEYYADALRLSWAVLKDLDQARQAVMQAFTSALVNQYRYRVGQNAQTWLFGFVIQAVRKAGRVQSGARDSGVEERPGAESSLDGFLQRLDADNRWAFYVWAILGWPPAETAELVGVEADRVERLIVSLGHENLHPAASPRPVHAVTTLERSFADRFPRPSIAEDEQEEIAARLVRAVEQRTGRDLGLMRLWETFLTAAGVVLVTGLILWLNQTLPDVSPKTGGVTPTPRLIRVTRVVLVPVTATARATTSRLTNYTVQPGDSLDSVANLFGMAVSDLMRLNDLSANAGLHVGQSLKVLTSPHIRLRGAGVASVLAPLPPPLNASSTARDVIQRLTSSQSLWSSVWVDAQLTLNGPAGYLGPPDVTFEQAWVDNPGKRSIELSGKSSSHPDWVYSVSGNAASQIDRQSSQPQDSLSIQLVQNKALRAMLFPLNSDWLSFAENLVIGPVTPYIGRETLLVNVMNASDFLQAQLWVDVETGVILRELRYSGDRSKVQTADFSITKISYNNHFAAGLFNPPARLAAGFSTDASGLDGKLVNQLELPENSQAHQPFAAGLPPNGFNPDQALLFFRFPDTFNTTAASAVVDVLAGGYSLGEAQFGNPWTAICARSPDGQKIGYVSQPLNIGSGDATLHWFELQNVNQDHLVSGDLAVDNFAFSYDGQKLAFFGRQAGQVRGAVYIYDLQNSALQRLLDRNSADSLVWSPDGKYLAMTSAPSMFGSQDALVVNVQDSIIIAHDRYNWQGDFALDPLIPNWPTFNWRTPKGTPVKFPVSMGGLEACVQPPG